jgi:transcriptional repressor NrdR
VQCPYCESDSRVVDSRAASDGVRRRRVCNACRRRFTTYERVGSPAIRVLKRSGKSQPFDPNKIRSVLLRVTRHRPSIGERDVERLVRDLEGRLDDSGERSVRSGRIAELLLARLAELDRLAYDRFAANYLDETGQLRTDFPRPMTDEEAQQLGLFRPDEPHEDES